MLLLLWLFVLLPIKTCDPQFPSQISKWINLFLFLHRKTWHFSLDATRINSLCTHSKSDPRFHIIFFQYQQIKITCSSHIKEAMKDFKFVFVFVHRGLENLGENVRCSSPGKCFYEIYFFISVDKTAISRCYMTYNSVNSRKLITN